MIKNVLTHIGGVGLYGVISILIFVGIFVAVGVWMMCLNKSYYTSMQALPLEDDRPVKPSEQTSNSNSNSN